MRQVMERLIANGVINFKDDPEIPGGGSDQNSVEDSTVESSQPQDDSGTDKVDEQPQASESEDGGNTGDGDDKNTDDSEKAKLLKETMKRKEQIKELRAELDKAKGENAELETLKASLGELTAEDIGTIRKEREDAQRKELEAKGEYEQIVAAMRVEREKETDDLNATIASLQERLSERDRDIDEMTVGRAFSESPFILNRSTLPAGIARKEFSDHFDLRDGQLVAFDKPRNAEGRTPLVDADGNYKPFEVAIESLYASHRDAESLIKSTTKRGAGSPGADDKPTGMSPASGGADVKSGKARIAAGLSQIRAN